MAKGGVRKETRSVLEQEVESLRRRIAELQGLFDHAPVGFCYFDTDLRFVHLNERLAQINGLSITSLLGRTLSELRPDGGPEVERQLRQVIATGQPIVGGTVVAETPAHPGVAHTYEHYFDPVVGADGAVAGISCLVLDVTGREEDAHRLRRWKHIFEEIKTAIIVSAPDGTIELANPAAHRQYGVSAKHLVGRHVQDLYAPQVREDVAGYSRKANEEGYVSFESTHVRHDGTLLDVQVTVTAVRDEHGTVGYRVATIEDITERKRLEAIRLDTESGLRRVAEQQKAQEFLGRLVRGAPDAIIVSTGDGRVTLANQQAEVLFGYTQDELTQLSVEQLMPDRFRTGHLRDRQQYVAAPVVRLMGARSGNLAGLRKDGKEFPAEISLAPLETDEGPLVITSVRDLSERRRLEAETRRHREELAHVTRVASLGELQSALAHELNQPLTATLSNAQTAARLLEQNALDLDELRDILSDIVADTRRAGTVIERARTMMKSGQVTHQSVDVNTLLRDVLVLVRSDVLIKGIAVRLEADAAVPRIDGDSVQLQQVVLNLVMNAAAAVADREQEARHVTVSSQHDASTVTVSVRDSGHGIPEADRSRLFEPFYTTKPEGLGMGLAVCRSLVEAHGGRIWVKDTSSAGTTVSVALPIDPSEAR